VAWGKGTWRNEFLALAKPLTFMNRSGVGIRTVLRKTHANVDELIVIHDDLDLALGRLKFKQRGGGGGHKGIISIIEDLGQDDFLRLRIGIGRPIGGMDPSEYVLSDFNEEEHAVVEEALDMAADALRTLIQEGLPKTMNFFHTKSITEDH
jgi:PTH1 family peptidyl-tRNA hydrolase